MNRNKSKMPISYSLQRIIFKLSSGATLDDYIAKRAVKYGIQKMGNFINHMFNVKQTPELFHFTRKYLIEKYFKEDISSLEKLLNIDLNSWKA